MKKPTSYANIICNQALRPYKMIISNGQYTTEIPVLNSSIKNCKKAALDVYGVKPENVLVSQVMDGKQ